jgi:hypothetical protein
MLNAEPVTETTDDGGCDELEEGEERSQQSSKQDGDERVRSSQQRTKAFDIRLLKKEQISTTEKQIPMAYSVHKSL